ncbi:MAG TPA: type I-E CRISPR-associated protein Cas7/Cse4/CasC [Cellvibrio sp.]|nr:type I-E CRISPR-associated protein Cas7/Cse4/CasC [Cellvibrio sp.]
MSRFLQLHLLTSYPPANLNRDDLGRPKTAKMGGVDRLRVSSQSLKRTWRTSDVFAASLNEPLGERTKLFGTQIFLHLIKGGVPFNKAVETAKQISGIFGKNESSSDLKKMKDEDRGKYSSKLQKKWAARDKENMGIADYSVEQLNELEVLDISQLAFVSIEEKQAAYALANKVIQGDEIKDNLTVLRDTTSNVDIALFGRMLADTPSKNIEAACQVAHAISVHGVVIEDDYFTAVDDLNDNSNDAGAAHIGETGFAAGLFYSYICINRELLIENLNGDKALADKAIQALTEAAVKVAPAGKQNSFGSHAYASYVRAELGNQQPRSLSVAFLKPLGKNVEDYAADAIAVLEKQAANFDKVYGACYEKPYTLNAIAAEGSINELLEFVTQ